MKAQLLDKHRTEKTTHFDFIRGLLAMRKITGRRIAESIGVTESYVSHVLAGRNKNRRVQQAVADALGMTFEELWSTKP